jgi:tetratricopeptide (TPR) repeat protein
MRTFMVLFFCVLTLPVAAQYQELDKQLSKALMAWDLGDNTDAYQMLSDVVRQRPYFAEPYYLRALVLESIFQYEEALTDLNILLELNTRHVEGLFLRGQVRNQLGQYDLAIKDLQMLLNMPSREQVTVIYQRPKSFSAISRVSFLEGNNLDVIYHNLALAEMGRKNPDSAIDWLNQALKINSENCEYLLARAKAHSQKGEIFKAESDIRQALAKKPYHSEGNQLLIGLLLDRSRPQSTDIFYTAVIAEQPDFVLPFQQRGYQRMLAGRWSDALEDFQRVVELKPEDADAWVFSGMIEVRLGANQEALQKFEKALQYKPDHRQALYGIGNIHFKARKYEEAISFYSMTIFYHPHFAEAYFQRGYAYHSLGNSNSCCQDLQRAGDRGLEAASKSWNMICK